MKIVEKGGEKVGPGLQLRFHHRSLLGVEQLAGNLVVHLVRSTAIKNENLLELLSKQRRRLNLELFNSAVAGKAAQDVQFLQEIQWANIKTHLKILKSSSTVLSYLERCDSEDGYEKPRREVA